MYCKCSYLVLCSLKYSPPLTSHFIPSNYICACIISTVQGVPSVIKLWVMTLKHVNVINSFISAGTLLVRQRDREPSLCPSFFASFAFTYPGHLWLSRDEISFSFTRYDKMFHWKMRKKKKGSFFQQASFFHASVPAFLFLHENMDGEKGRLSFSYTQRSDC